MTSKRDDQEIAKVSIELAERAAVGIMAIYAKDFAVEYKSPGDPVTEADRGANALIVEGLMRAFPGVPIVAEESNAASYAGFEKAEAAFFVDPVDGTRDFVGKTGEFTVMLGFAEKGRATIGVVVWPTKKRTFVGIVGWGNGKGTAYELSPDGSKKNLTLSGTTDLAQASMLITRSRRTPEMMARLERIGAKTLIPCGSSGLKAALVAAGEADLYAHPAPLGKRWDTCAGEALVFAAGGNATDLGGRFIDYRTANLANAGGFVASNGHLHEAALERLGNDVGAEE